MPPVQSKPLSRGQLAALWNTPRREDGKTPKQLCLAFGLREAWRAQYGEEKTYGMLEFVKDRLRKRCKLSVSTSALHQFFKKFDADPDQFPGKIYGAWRGRKRALSGTREAAVARSLMARNANHDMEPTASAAITWNPKATLNLATGQPVDKKIIHRIMKTLCHDGDPSEPWVHGAVFARIALKPDDLKRRYAWCAHTAGLGHSAEWYNGRCKSVRSETLF